MKNFFLSSGMPLVLPLLAGAWACQKSIPGASEVSIASKNSEALVTGDAGTFNLAGSTPGGVATTTGAPAANSGGWGDPTTGNVAPAAAPIDGVAPTSTPSPTPVDGVQVTAGPGTSTSTVTSSERPNPGGVTANLNPVPGDGGTTPLVLDWNRDGIITTSLAAGKGYVPFDIAARGEKRSLEWISEDDAILCLDLNANGAVDDGRELFGSATKLQDKKGDTITAQHGFLALAQYDTNHNGLIDAMDPVFTSLLLWRDKNHNGISESSELTKLAETDLTAISLSYRDLATVLGLLPKSLSFVGQTSIYMTRSGASFEIADVYFAEQKSWTFAQSIQSK